MFCLVLLVNLCQLFLDLFLGDLLIMFMFYLPTVLFSQCLKQKHDEFKYFLQYFCRCGIQAFMCAVVHSLFVALRQVLTGPETR